MLQWDQAEAGTLPKISFYRYSDFPSFLVQFCSVQSLSRVRLFATPWIAARQASLSITNSQSSFRLTSIRSVMPSSHLIFSISSLIIHLWRHSSWVYSEDPHLIRSRAGTCEPSVWAINISTDAVHLPGLTCSHCSCFSRSHITLRIWIKPGSSPRNMNIERNTPNFISTMGSSSIPD